MSRDLARNIRRLCNHPWKRELIFEDRVKWNKLWASVDLIYDTHEAIDFYLSIPEAEFNKGGYLYVFGILQALFVQQEAASDLNIALFGVKIDYKKDYPKLFEIRDHRNDSVGHPTQRNNDNSFHIIIGTSITKSGFELISRFPKTGKSMRIERVEVVKCIETQNKLIESILESAMDKLKSDYEQHKNKFQGTPLINVIPTDIDYCLSKLYEFESPLVPANHKYISEVYDKVKDGITQRYHSLEALPGVKLTTERLDYILLRLKNNLIKSKIADELELEVFVDALKGHFSELVDMIKEIDKEFEE